MHKNKAIEVSKEEWLSQLLLLIWQQMGIEDIEALDDSAGD
jgi:hypothetical protein